MPSVPTQSRSFFLSINGRYRKPPEHYLWTPVTSSETSIRALRHDVKRVVGKRLTLDLAKALLRFALHRQAVLITRALAIQLGGAELREAIRRESAQEVHQIVNLARGKP